MQSLTANTRRLIFCAVAFTAGVSLLFYVITKFLALTLEMRFSFTGWMLILVGLVLLSTCVIYAILGIGFCFRLSDVLTERDGQVMWKFKFDVGHRESNNEFAVLRNKSGLWIVRTDSNAA